jgi:hypothetical protein
MVGLLAVAAAAAAVPGPAAGASTRYEAEDATVFEGTVATNHTGYSGTGFVDYANVTGSSVEWTVTAAVAGTATLAIRYANGTTTNRPMDVAVNGTVVAAGLAFAGTGSWDTWQTASVTAAAPAGVTTVRATATTSNGGPNVDYLDLTVVAPTYDYQAEDATISQGVVATNHTGYTGTGFVDYANVTGSSIEWTVHAPDAGTATLAIRYANGTTTNRPMDIAVNGTVVVAGLAFPGTGSWDTWQTVTTRAALSPGANTIRATATTTSGGPNVDKLSVDVGATRVLTVSSIAGLQAAADNAVPGDLIELADGTYTTAAPVQLTRSGTPGAPITVAAQHLGRAQVAGTDGFAFGPVSFVTVVGFRLTHAKGVVIPAGTSHVRLTRNVIQISSGSTTNWATVVGDDAQVDHNTFQHKSSIGVFLQITGPGGTDMAQRARIHHNYFLDHSYGGSNGGESIRLGYSYRQLSSAYATIEDNLFEQANGDSEAISVKSSDNTIRFNTIRNSRGSIVLRHGNRNLVEGNLMLGGASGIRFYENDHVIVDNLIQGGTGQVIAGSGTVVDDTTGGTEHARADRVLVAFNTVAGTAVPLLDVGPGGDPYGPDGCTFADNILLGTGSGALATVENGTNLRWEGNILWGGTGGNLPAGGYRLVDPALVTDAGGLYRLGGTSPAIDTAAGSYPQVTRDMDLQARSGTKDVGADEFATAAGPLRSPLTTADVGPAAP